MLADRKDSKHSEHVGGDRAIHSPQFGQIESAAFSGIPPGEQEVSNPTALPGIGVRDFGSGGQWPLGSPAESRP